jgi:hypothetical protein
MTAPFDDKRIFPFEPSIASPGGPPADRFIRRVWGPARVAMGLGLTAAWIALIAYGLVLLLAFPL